MRKSTIILIVILALIVLIISFFPKNCGETALTVNGESSIDCNCVGFKSSTVNSNDIPQVYCYGICLKNTCKTSIINPTPRIGGCAGVYYPYWNECCENWAKENNIVHIMCVGGWTVENDTCVWKCSTENEFCGHSYDSCNKDEDCVINGDTCQNKNNITEVPADIWRDCSNYTKYHLSCMCASGQCKWVGGIV